LNRLPGPALALAPVNESRKMTVADEGARHAEIEIEIKATK
jgi:hypothetical protein